MINPDKNIKELHQKLNIQKAINVLNYVNQFILNHPESLREEGVFRVAGQAQDIEHLLQDVESQKTLQTLKNVDVHNVIGMLKKATKVDNFVADLELSKKFDEITREENQENASNDMKTLILNLTRGSKEDQQLGVLLFSIIQLCREALQHEETNKMTARNLAIGFLNPLIALTIGKADPLALTSHENALVNILNDDFYSQPMQSALKSKLKDHVNFQAAKELEKEINDLNNPKKKMQTLKEKKEHKSLFSSMRNIFATKSKAPASKTEDKPINKPSKPSQ